MIISDNFAKADYDGQHHKCDDNEHKMGASVPSLCRVAQPGVEPALVFNPRESNEGNWGSSSLLFCNNRKKYTLCTTQTQTEPPLNNILIDTDVTQSTSCAVS